MISSKRNASRMVRIEINIFAHLGSDKNIVKLRPQSIKQFVFNTFELSFELYATLKKIEIL